MASLPSRGTSLEENTRFKNAILSALYFRPCGQLPERTRKEAQQDLPQQASLWTKAELQTLLRRQYCFGEPLPIGSSPQIPACWAIQIYFVVHFDLRIIEDNTARDFAGADRDETVFTQ
jgi:hypothetical protein